MDFKTLESQLEQDAIRFRSDHGMSDREPIRLKSLLMYLNVQTMFRPMSEGMSGMAIKSDQSLSPLRFVLINSAKSLGHQHFTICHELYHLYIQPDFTSMVCSTGRFERKSKVEYQADVFASYLLLPESGILYLIPRDEIETDKISLATILKIENYFACSRAALLFRLKKLKLITQSKADQFNQNIRKSAIAYGYSTTLYEHGNSGEVIGDYGSLARELYDKEFISQSHYYTLLQDLGMDPEEIEISEHEGTSTNHID